MKKVFMLQAVLVLALILFRPSEAEASVIALENGMWVEESEAVLYEVPKGTDGINLAAENGSAYSEYDFEKQFSFYSKDAKGNDLKIFTIAVTGTVYFYENGKVHLFRCGSRVVDVIRRQYEITKYDPKIENTDGSYSSGLVLFVTYDDVYPSGDFAVKVYFMSGSNQIYGDLTVVRLRGEEW